VPIVGLVIAAIRAYKHGAPDEACADLASPSDFELRISFVIWHSSFVIAIRFRPPPQRLVAFRQAGVLFDVASVSSPNNSSAAC
jgi:hypothetical protein